MPRKKNTDLEKPPEEGAATTTVTSPTDGDGQQTTAVVEQPNGNGEERKGPCFKVGPIPTDSNNSVDACVWDRLVTANDGREFTVYSVSVQCSWRDSDGSWKNGRSFRSSQIPVLIFALQRCWEWVQTQRDPEAKCPF